MTASTSPMVAPEAVLFSAAVNAVNTWRGRCLASFAAVEAQVTDALVVIAATNPATALPHLVGQRCSALAAALSEAGPAAAEASVALAQWQLHDPLRAFLGHGVAKVTVARDGTWQAVFDLAALRGRKLQRSFLIVDEAEADDMTRQLNRARQKLESRLTPPLGAPSRPTPVTLRTGSFP